MFFESDWRPESGEQNGNADPQLVELSEDEANHAVRVLRLSPGDPAHLTNGHGVLGIGRINTVDARPIRVQLEITTVRLDRGGRPDLILASAIPKGERQTLLIDIATQLGFDRLIPLECEFSAVGYKDSMAVRWQRIMKSACKQSRRLTMPVVAPPSSVSGLVEDISDQELLLYGDQHGQSISRIAKGIMQPVDAITVVAGPEGGFSQAETDHLVACDRAHAVSAGPNILRTEAAAVTLVGLANQLICWSRDLHDVEPD